MNDRLIIRNLCFSYPGMSELFHDVSLTLSSDRIYGLRGASGKGKTTFGQLLANHVKPTSGAIYIENDDSTTTKRNPVQLVSQNPDESINPSWTMKKVLTKETQVSEELMKEMNIEKDWLSRYLYELSGGELQRICLARVLSAEPKFLIADEVTAMLDPITQARIWKNLLTWVKKKKIGLVVISHNDALLQQVCDEIIDIEHLQGKRRRENVI
ncbi:ATP-binding cassette domain-containing protein [Vagococcus lutrae]|uniref:ATP-binding cassette domain-containing protein n=1 Tax=Vagococcus lutrae TaxID=81947 RepID=UPI000F889A65|nr:ATP-binding cassette domain-containing protein [Vagococcus lutrae]RST91266.1 hypothetical protein CBF33_07510 [Vagococcus lutrae]